MGNGRSNRWLSLSCTPFVWKESHTCHLIDLAMEVALSDLNGDGLPALAAFSPNPSQISVGISNGGSLSTWESTSIDGTISEENILWVNQGNRLLLCGLT